MKCIFVCVSYVLYISDHAAQQVSSKNCSLRVKSYRQQYMLFAVHHTIATACADTLFRQSTVTGTPADPYIAPDFRLQFGNAYYCFGRLQS